MEEIASGNVEWVKGRRFKEEAADPAANKRKPRERASPKGARLDPPKLVEPQLATLVEAPPDGKEWLHEIKFDGYRVEAAIGGGRAVIYTRTGLDWTDKFRSIVQPLADLPCRSALIDGEAVVQDENGKSNFGKLQNAIAEGKGAIVYYAFDLLSLDGEDLRKLPLIERKKRLAKLLEDQPERRAAVLFRPRRRQRPPYLRAGLRDEARGHRLEARRGALSLRPDQGLAEGEVRHGAGTHHRRLAALDGEGAAVLVAAGGDARRGQAHLSRQDRHRLRRAGTEGGVGGTGEAAGEDAGGRRCAGRHPAEVEIREAGPRRRSRVRRLDRGRLRPPRRLQGPQNRQEGGGGCRARKRRNRRRHRPWSPSPTTSATAAR